MSSIYRKGRDGYFYYQAYIYNLKTKKKDKRIFHSLKTKDRDLATLKKRKYDLLYEKKKRKTNHVYLLLICSILLFFIIPFTYFNNFKKNKNSQNISNINLSNIEKKNIKTKDVENKKVKNDISILNINKNKINETIQPKKPEVLKYKVLKVFEGSDTFKQGKVYAGLENNLIAAKKEEICNQLKNQFSRFENIIICLFLINENKKNMPLSFRENLTAEQKKSFWIGLYTFNLVEGAFFDPTPSKYLEFDDF